jgi:hypothetical protein
MLAPQLLHNVQFDGVRARSHHSKRSGRGIGHVNRASLNVRTAIVDADRDRLPVGGVGDAQLRAERQ